MSIALVGEAWGEAEERARMPFVGPSGHLLNSMLEDVGIRRADCLVTNVFNLRPQPRNDVTNLCVPKRECGHGLPALAPGKYVRAEYLTELTRLYAELEEFRPNVVVALGSTAAWALTAESAISKIRGAVAEGRPLIGKWSGAKVLPTYHPAAVLRDYSLRPVTTLDLFKAKQESAFPEIRRPERLVLIPETIDELRALVSAHLADARILSVDIETAGDQITCIGFAPSVSVSVVVPIVHATRGGSFWSRADELTAWAIIRDVLALPIPKVGQNFQYDMAFLWRRYGIPCNQVAHDTMLLSHALQPESPKGLAFLGSIYTNEASWKLLNKRGKTTIKRED